MKHCILMTVYKDVEQINRIIEFAPENFDFYVHIHYCPDKIRNM